MSTVMVRIRRRRICWLVECEQCDHRSRHLRFRAAKERARGHAYRHWYHRGTGR